jgi:hypothetical protein
MRQYVKYSNLSALFLAKRQELDRPVKCRCLSSADTSVAVCLFMLMLGMVLGVWLCQTIGR